MTTIKRGELLWSLVWQGKFIEPFGKAPRASHWLDLIQSYIGGPMNVKTRRDAFYLLNLIDIFSLYRYLYLISLFIDIKLLENLCCRGLE